MCRANDGVDCDRPDGVASNNRPHDSHAGCGYGDCVQSFYSMLNIRREIAAGERPQPNGWYVGDGIARTLDGTPYEPLDWSNLKG